MRMLSIDIETFSPVQLAKTGLYPYAEHPDFELLLFGYSIDGGPIEVVDLASGETLPDEVLAALVDPSVVKWAHNVALHYDLVGLPWSADEPRRGGHGP